MKDKFRGIVLASVIGDAIGKSFEDLDVYQIEEFYRNIPIDEFVEPHPSSPAYFQEPNEPSDETAVAMLLIESIVQSKKLDIYHYFDLLQSWAFDEKLHKYPDPFILKAIYNISNGISDGFNYSSIEGILRVIGTSMLHFNNIDLAKEASKLTVALTHRAEVALDSAVIFTDILVRSINNDEILDTYENRIKLLKAIKEELKNKASKDMLDMLIDSIEESYSKDKAIINIGNGNYVLESLGLSLYYFFSEGIEHPYEAFIDAINSYWEFGGDTDAIGFITGALIGAYHGYEFLPKDLVKNLKDHKYYIELSDKLYDIAKNT